MNKTVTIGIYKRFDPYTARSIWEYTDEELYCLRNYLSNTPGGGASVELIEKELDRREQVKCVR